MRFRKYLPVAIGLLALGVTLVDIKLPVILVDSRVYSLNLGFHFE